MPRPRCRLILLLVGVGTLIVSPGHTQPTHDFVAGSLVQLNDNGAWPCRPTLTR
jgi:hypothetical protein